MSYLNREELIGWYNEKIDNFLCSECFSKRKNIDKRDYKPISENELEEKDLYICDECEEQFS